MAVAADLWVEAPLASPELALVDPELGAELRRTHSPVEDRWVRSPARVDDASAEGEDAPAQNESADDARHLESGTEQQDGDKSIVASAAEFDEASAESDDASAPWAVAVVHPEAEALAEHVLADEYIVATPAHTPEEEEEERARSHYPVLPAPTDAEATDAADDAFRRIREGITEANERPSRKRRIRRGFTLASGAVTVCAVAVLAADVHLQVAQLPGWLQF